MPARRFGLPTGLPKGLPRGLPRGLLGGHLGSSVSALVDGQLGEDESERAWQHVLRCPACRRLVEHEGWVKRQLAQIGGASGTATPSDGLMGSLLRLDPASVAWADARQIERTGRGRRRAGIALVGAGSVSAAVFGLSTLSGAPMGIGGSSGAPASSLGGATTRSTDAVVAPTASVHGRLPGWRVARGRAHLVDVRR
jgi:hypothetical protein